MNLEKLMDELLTLEDHIVENATYGLMASDLRSLEFYSKYF